MPLRDTVDFLLHDWLRVGELSSRPRFAEHSRETFDAVLDTCERIAREKFAPFNRLVDTEEELRPALRAALLLDDRVLVEQVVVGREVDVAVLDDPDGGRRVGPPLEILVDGRLFDTTTKYDGSATFVIPAQTPPGDCMFSPTLILSLHIH